MSFVLNISLHIMLFSLFLLHSKSTDYYVDPSGDDKNAGTKESPFATLAAAYRTVVEYDTIYIRGGVYRVTPDQIMGTVTPFAAVFHITKKHINIFGYPGERPIFDLSQVKLTNLRVSVFYVTGSYNHFKNFEVVGTQVSIIGHSQSECFSNRNGNNNIYENLAMHDGMAIGFYLTKGSNNLVLNCDAYNNIDTISDGGRGGNVDGFGGHAASGSVNNTFRGCRSWYNSDDGFDLINCREAFTIDHCWSFYNGYRPGGFKSAGDGAGFKSGGYGMSANPSVPSIIPNHVVMWCIAYYNKNRGFYANHHLGGLVFKHNSGYKNPSNFCMLNRKSKEETVDVPGYDHIIENNLSYEPRSSGQHLIDYNAELCTINNNTFYPTNQAVTADDFVSLDETQLMKPRKEDGSLPDIDFLRLKKNSDLYQLGYGHSVPE